MSFDSSWMYRTGEESHNPWGNICLLGVRSGQASGIQYLSMGVDCLSSVAEPCL